MAKNTDTITLGLGDLSVDGVDVGYLGGEVVFTTDIEAKDFRVGVPQHTVKRVITGFETSIKASLAQIDASTVGLALGIGSASTPNGNARISFGTSWQLAELNNVQFLHTRPNGKTVKIFFPKAQVKPGSQELRFSTDDYILQDVTITALYDSRTAASSYPLGYIEFES